MQTLSNKRHSPQSQFVEYLNLLKMSSSYHNVMLTKWFVLVAAANSYNAKVDQLLVKVPKELNSHSPHFKQEIS